MQYQQNNLNAEYIQDQQKIYPQYYQGQLPSGQPLMGQPVVQNPQLPNGQQGFYAGQDHQRLQQVFIIPNRGVIVVEQSLDLLNLKDHNLRQQCRYFYGCNCCFGLLALIFMIVRCIAAFGYDGIIVAAGVLYIVSDFSFVTAVICGQYAISKYKEKLLLYYQRLVFIAMICEIAGSGIAFAYYRQQQNEENQKNDRKTDEKGKETEEYVNLIVFIVFLVILVFAYGAFIRLGKRIRFLMLDLFQARQQITNQSNQQR